MWLLTDHLRDRNNRKAILAGAGAIYQAPTTVHQAKRRLQKWIERWKDTEPHAVRSFAYDFELTLTYLTAPVEWQSRLKTSNPIERFIRELNRKLKQIGIFPNADSWERCAWLVWKLLEATGYAPTSPDHPKTAFAQNT